MQICGSKEYDSNRAPEKIRAGDVNLGIIFLEVMDEDAGEQNMHCFFLQTCREYSLHFLPEQSGGACCSGVSLVIHSYSEHFPSVECKMLYRCDLVLHKCCHAHYSERNVLKLAKYMPASVLLFEAAMPNSPDLGGHGTVDPAEGVAKTEDGPPDLPEHSAVWVISGQPCWLKVA